MADTRGVPEKHGGGAEGRIRQGLLQDDLVEAVIGLAPNLFYGTTIAGAAALMGWERFCAKSR